MDVTFVLDIFPPTWHAKDLLSCVRRRVTGYAHWGPPGELQNCLNSDKSNKNNPALNGWNTADTA